MDKQTLHEFIKSQNDWPLSVSDTAKKLANELGETPATWQVRLTNWRRDGRTPPLQHHQEPGKRPCYMTSDVDTFIKRRLAGRAAYTGKSPQLAGAKAIADQHGIILEWNSPAAFGRIRLNLDTARTLGKQLVALADRYDAQVQDDDK